MKWKDLIIGGKTLSMAHLQPFDLMFDVADEQVTVKFEFGFHCFTDEKGKGESLCFRHERRYFCEDRYHCSTQLRDYMERRFYNGLAVPYFVENNQRYYCLDLHDYAIFFSISKPANTTNLLKLRVISAYEVATWGRHSLPRGKPHNVRYILEVRNAGKSI
ncbi:hypothetical protein NTG44_15695 [Pseudomonas sp. 20P_3.2_Bac4]|nr:hypothetical protein [Pseudomonas sp. 5P_5.1_Bac1]MCU1733154.1 hypothetical protein [Pseudomonas sp. 20P_3.2_Bac4]MCU1745272.1 hypothetical protein [Pseudomonas sp. 20P_3.2_Bac5]